MTTSKLQAFSTRAKARWVRPQTETWTAAFMDDIYSELPVKRGVKTYIRLAKLEYPPAQLPSSVMPKVQINLQEVPIQTEKPYVAISYTWGEGSDTATILLNDKPFSVRASLFAFLNQMKLIKYAGLMWIDALCINQANNLERSHQVAVMGDIYSRASEVLVWLYPETSSLRRAVRYLSGFEQDADCYGLPVQPKESFNDFWENLPYAGMLELLRHPYWTRAWIAQEFILAPKVKLCCGLARADADTLILLSFRLKAPDGWDLSRWKLMGGTLSFSKAAKLRRYRYQERAHRTFRPWLLLELGIADCADVRDRVYSQLALMNAGRAIKPDYDKSASDLFTELIELQSQFDETYIEEAVRGLQRLLQIGDDHPTIQKLIAQNHMNSILVDQASEEELEPSEYPLWLWIDHERLVALGLTEKEVLSLNKI